MVIMGNQKGFIVTDFIFAIVIGFGLVIATFSICYSLVAVEVAQYIVYSSARAGVPSFVDAGSDRSVAVGKKFANLKRQFGMFASDAWFDLQLTNAFSTDMASEYGEPTGTASRPFWGVKAELTVNLLNIKFPLLGSTGDEAYKANVTAFLFPEPTQKLCINSMASRGSSIIRLDSKYSQTGTYNDSPEDNGC